ncbi:hypothetical protein MTR67_023161 [Solanum verrucosum]|uniref:Uncharacterized protein n=1 Tax=Solanum verrucosum TaxID=315347 RepID=A0AAF0QUN9_SOLVR|nr:hypothetical protein MTR67_023161 [Solanum verrucosum]
MSVLYHPSKVNVVAAAISRLSIDSVAHVEDDVKAKQDLDPVLVDLKKSVSGKKPLRLSHKREMMSFDTKVVMCSEC